jgi:hypothetical protein
LDQPTVDWSASTGSGRLPGRRLVLVGFPKHEAALDLKKLKIYIIFKND